ncbi:MAG: histidinol-phosphate transaminase [Candidatus Hodarchaeaceae archaeon]|nr:histidinol-phosphate transaminase [Candidatus Hodarchaeaceae archaeon]
MSNVRPKCQKVRGMLSRRVEELSRSGMVYPLADSARECDIESKAVVKLSSNESPLGPSPSVLRAIRREAKYIGLYPDPRAGELKRAIADYLDIDVECIAIGNGSDELVDLICKAFMDPNDRALIPLPTFSMYEIACRVNGGSPKFVELPNFRWRAAELSDAMSDARLAFIGRPNNPTGNSISLIGLRKLIACGKLIVVDEAYAEFAGYSVVKEATRRENLLVLRTFSKAFGLAGVRIGYAIGSPELVDALERIRAPFNVNRIAQSAAVAALRDGRYLQKVVGVVRAGRDYLRRELSKAGMLVLPSDANFLMADVRPLDTDAPRLCEFLARRGILIRDLSRFRGAGPSYVRISVGTPRQNERLVVAVRKFKGGG